MKEISKNHLLPIAFLSGAIAVAMGAMGAHALKTKIDAGQLLAFETAVRYQMYHTLALISILLLNEKMPIKYIKLVCYLFILGIILFSGSLYFLSIKALLGVYNFKWIGAITPLGGLALIAGWILAAISAVKSKF